MRWLLMLLVVLNLLFYLFHLNQAGPVAEPSSQLTASTREPDIRLLSEAEPFLRRKPVNDSSNLCLLIGGFNEESVAQAVEQRLLSLDIESRTQAVDEAAGVDYWVYLPPLVSRQASLRQLRELQSRNIDSYIITVGDLSNGISLGIFSRKDSAESVVSRLQGVDYTALIRELPRSHRRYWVRVAGEHKPLLGDELLAELVDSFPALESRQLPCSSIATSE